MSAINLMGIELEGAWKGTHRDRPFEDVTIKHDGSVCFKQPEDGSYYIHYGELVSKPMPPEDLVEWAKEHAPTHANDSAGTHIHVSLKKKSMYACLLTPSFQKKLMAEYMKYNELFKYTDPETYNRFLHRLEGRNSYCQKGYKGLQQVEMTSRGGARYQQLNYCWVLHGTMEIRVLPCTTNKEFLAGIIRLTQEVIEEFVATEHIIKKIHFRRG